MKPAKQPFMHTIKGRAPDVYPTAKHMNQKGESMISLLATFYEATSFTYAMMEAMVKRDLENQPDLTAEEMDALLQARRERRQHKEESK